MRKLCALLILAAVLISAFQGLGQRLEWNLMGVHNQQGDFVGCPYSGTDCAAF